MLDKLEVDDDLCVEQAHRIRSDRISKSWRELLGDCRTADHVVALENDCL